MQPRRLPKPRYQPAPQRSGKVPRREGSAAGCCPANHDRAHQGVFQPGLEAALARPPIAQLLMTDARDRILNAALYGVFAE